MPTYELFSSTEILGRMAMERMLAELSTRRYPVGPGTGRGAGRAGRPRATSKSAVSAPVRGRDRDGAGRAARRGSVRAGPGRVDDRRGALRRASCCVVALGIGIDGDQAPARAGRRIDGEHHPGRPTADRTARTRPGTHPADPGRASTASKALRAAVHRRVRPSGDRSAVSCTRSATSPTSCPVDLAQGRPSRMTRRLPRRLGARGRSDASRPWRRSSTALTPARRDRCAKGWRRRSPCCDWASRRRWRGRCGRPTASSR